MTPASRRSAVTSVLCGYSLLFMRFAWMVTPRNYFLLVTHAVNEGVQSYQLSRALAHQSSVAGAPAAAAAAPATAADSKSPAKTQPLQ
jgi:hypothetical protein